MAGGAVGAVAALHGRSARTPQIAGPESAVPAPSAPVTRSAARRANRSHPTPRARRPSRPARRVPARKQIRSPPSSISLQRAHAAYTRRDFSAALTLIAEHARRFPQRASRRAARGVARAVAAGSGRADEAHRAAAAFAVRFPRSVLLPRVAGGSESRGAVIVRARGPTRLRRRGPSIVGGAVRGRGPRSAIDRPARIRGRARLSRRRGLQGRRDRPARVTTPSSKARRSSVLVRIEPRHRDHRRTHRVARCERQVGRRAGVPVGEHRLSPPGARDGLCARRADSAPGKGGRRSRRERRGAGRDRIPAPRSAAITVAKPRSRDAAAGGADHRALRPPGPRRPPGRGPVFAVGAGPAVGFGMSSSPVMLGRLFGAVAWPHLSFELAAVVSLPATTRRATAPASRSSILLGSAAACATVVAMERMRRRERAARSEWPARTSSARLGDRADRRSRGARRASCSASGAASSSARHADGLVNLTRWTGSLDQVPGLDRAAIRSARIGVDAGVRFP